MLKNILQKIARGIAPSYIQELEQKASDADAKISQRVAAIISQMDPLEPAMKLFNGIFSEDFQKPEQNMDARSRLQFLMWAYQQHTDPSFIHMIEWIMNTAGNQMTRHKPVDRDNATEILMYGRSQISNMILLKKEIGRLSSLYEDMLQKNKQVYVDEGTTVE